MGGGGSSDGGRVGRAGREGGVCVCVCVGGGGGGLTEEWRGVQRD